MNISLDVSCAARLCHPGFVSTHSSTLFGWRPVGYHRQKGWACDTVAAPPISKMELRILWINATIYILTGINWGYLPVTRNLPWLKMSKLHQITLLHLYKVWFGWISWSPVWQVLCRLSGDFFGQMTFMAKNASQGAGWLAGRSPNKKSPIIFLVMFIWF